MRVQVHPNGTSISIDRKTVKWDYVGGHTEAQPRDADWLKEYFVCRHCGKKLPLMRAAFAIWKFEQACCSVKCVNDEFDKRHACCDKAKRIHCVCMAAYSCPVHGEKHIGTHD